MNAAPSPLLTFQSTVTSDDVRAVRTLVEATGFFNDEEIGIAEELALDSAEKAERSDYIFILARSGQRLCGFSCFGKIPCTKRSYDLYWIATDPEFQGMGIGRELLNRSEESCITLGGVTLYADTSDKPQYAPTRNFYEHMGFKRVATLPDFYDSNDAKVIYAKPLLAK